MYEEKTYIKVYKFIKFFREIILTNFILINIHQQKKHINLFILLFMRKEFCTIFLFFLCLIRFMIFWNSLCWSASIIYWKIFQSIRILQSLSNFFLISWTKPSSTQFHLYRLGEKFPRKIGDRKAPLKLPSIAKNAIY